MIYHLLASGSKGNCFVLEDKGVQIIIDCGTNKKYLTRSFHRISLQYKRTDAVLITHTHNDHISQLDMFKGVTLFAPIEIKDQIVNIVNPYQTFKIAHLDITPIPLSHDVELVVGYVIESATEKLVYVTDTGYFSQKNEAYIQDADYYIFESNHDPELLMATSRPFFIKQRILSSQGHLSNAEAAEVLAKVVTDRCKQVILAHISEDANDYDLAVSTVQSKLRNKTIVYAARQFEIIRGGRHE